MEQKGSLLIDTALILVAVMIAVALGTKYPLGVGGYVIIMLFSYLGICTLYAVAMTFAHLPRPRFSLHFTLAGVW